MPQGPGDEILDEIEKGTADDAIIKKYKVNGEQLRAFKSLHYGLSNQKMGYNEIEDYFPELNTYFKGAAQPAPAQPGIERPDFTKPVKQKALKESTARPTQAVTQLAETERPVQTMEMKFADKAKMASEVANKTLGENDDVVEKLIREGRYAQEQQKKLNEFAAGPRTDMPAAQALAMQRQMSLEPETKVQDIPVSKEEVAQSKAEIQSDEQQARHFLKQVAIKKPEKAKDIQSSLYMLDAAERLKQNPEAGNKVHENLGKLENGELEYDPTTGKLIRREGFFDSLVTGVKSRTEQINDYDSFQQPKEKVIEMMEKRLQNYDPDEPVPMPTGSGEIGQMTGMEWKSLLAGGAVGATVGRIAPQAAPFVTAALTAPEYYKRGYSSAFDQTYRQLRAEGKQPDEAYDIAIKQANTEAKLSAAEGAVSTVIGSRIGMKPLPKFNVTGGFKNAAAQILKKTTHYAGEVGIEGLADGLVAGYLQEQKNIAAKENNVFRTEGNEILENVKGEVTFALAMGAVTKAGSALVDPKLYNKLLYHLARQPKETVESKVGEMVMDGQIKEEDAQEALLKIEEQRKIDEKIPDNIKDVSRQAMADKIKRRQELEKELETKDEALHPPIKEEIKKLNEEILEHSKHVKPEDQVEEAEASEQQDETVASPEEQIPGAENNIGLEGKPVPGINEQQQMDLNAAQDQSQTEEPVSMPFIESPQVGQDTTPDVATGQEEMGQAKQQFYESNIGAAPTQTGRIKVDPIVGQKPKSISKIIGDVSKGLKQRLIYAKPGKRGWIGVYMPGFKGVKIKYNGDLDTTAHELGHAIDDQFDIHTEAVKDPAVIAELEEFANHGGSKPPANHPNPQKYIQQEGFAEWLRGYVVNPTEADRLAPHTTALFKRMASKKFQEEIAKFSNDFRVWRGSTNLDKTLANIQFKPDEAKGTLGKLFKKAQSNNNFSTNWVDKIAIVLTNPLRVFEKAWKHAKGIQGIDEVLPENDPIILSRLLLGIDGKFGEILKTGMINARGEVLTDADGNPKNLQWLLDPLDNTDQGSLEEDMKATIAYMISERVENDLSKNLDRSDLLTGAGAGVMSDFEIAQGTLNELYNGNPERLARIQEAAKRYREFADDIMQYAVDKGRLSQEAYDAMKENNEHYVAMQRILETEPDQEITPVTKGSGKNLGSKSEFLYKVKGSTKEIINPYVPLLDTLFKTLRESDRNEIMQAFTEMLSTDWGMGEGATFGTAEIGVPVSSTDKEAIPVFTNGKLQKWRFQKDVHNQLKGLDKEAYRIPAIFTILPRLLRAFTTKFPVFAVRNWIRDLQDRLIKTTSGSGFKDLVGKKEDWHAIARAGGLNTGHYFKDKAHYYGLLWEAMDGMAKNKKFILADPIRLKSLWHKYEDLLYKGETSNRVAEYRAAFKEAKKKGMDDYNAGMYAAYKARDLIDFAIMGNWMKVLNQIIPFSNAAIQGLRSGYVSYKKSPGRFLGRLAIYSIAPQIANWIWNHRNEEDEKQYEEHPSYVRDMFWNFRIGPDKWLSIPKPYELALPAAGIDRALSYHFSDNKKAFEGYDESIRKLMLPVDEGNLSGPYQGIVEVLTNKDFFRDRNIIPPDEDALNLTLRHTETASRLGQLIQNIAGIDARMVDHFIKRQFSYTGGVVEKLSDIGKEDSRHKFDLTDTGFFKRTPAYSSKSVQDMISFAKEWGLNKTPPYKAFNKIVGEYFDAKTGEERERIAEEMINYSKELLEAWKKEQMDQFQKERADAKKEERKK
jgi:hypothetical protein